MMVNPKHNTKPCVHGCGAEIKYQASHDRYCPVKNKTATETIPEGFTPGDKLIAQQSAGAADAGQPIPPAQPRTLEDIEKEFNTAENKTSDMKPPQENKDGTTGATISAANLIYIRFGYQFISGMLNKAFGTKDFPETDEETKKLEIATLAMLEEHKIKITPTLCFIIVIICAYVLPILKHIGIFDKIKEKFKAVKKAADEAGK